MKLIVAYDGSKDADVAIDDLRTCGLPATGSAEVVSVAEVWLPPSGSLQDETAVRQLPYIEEVLRESRERGEKAVVEAEMLAKFAVGRVKAALPDWNVTSFVSYGSPAWEILNEAERFNADLILVGAQGRSFLSRLVLGSISQRVLTEAHCSVRIGRGSIDLDSGPERIVVGFDGSRGSHGAIDAIASRNWTGGTEVRLVAASEPVTPTTIGRFVTPVKQVVEEINASERMWIESSAEGAIEKLRAKALTGSLRICPGNPKHVLPEEAERWGADCIFLGANAWGSRLERFLIGTTPAAVAARAHCSVEVVRCSKISTVSANIPHRGPNGKSA